MQALDNLGPLFKSSTKVINLRWECGQHLGAGSGARLDARSVRRRAFLFSQVGVAYLFSNPVANAPPTLGGMGVIEAALIFMLVGYGVSAGARSSAALVPARSLHGS